MDFLVWLLNCWGIVPLTDMLSMVSTRELATTDTPENREQAYYDMAWLTENMIMRNRTHGGYKVLLDELWEFCEQFNADMVILWEHMSCKALDGMHGLFEERAASTASTSSGSRTICSTRVSSRGRACVSRSMTICARSCRKSLWIRAWRS